MRECGNSKVDTAMTSGDSVSQWIGQLKGGDEDAAQKLWERYFQQLANLAYKKLHGTPKGFADQEDVALSAFDSFCRGVEQGRFPQLEDRNDLWRLLVVITVRKAIDLQDHENRQKRGGGQVIGETTLLGQSASGNFQGIDQFASTEPTPELAAQVAEECRRLLNRLDDPTLRSVALWKMEGYSTDEIAGKLQCVPRTVERKLRVIRSLWSQEISP
jgi:DNA-directed RNA polymerase specialized sigma24 family protein